MRRNNNNQSEEVNHLNKIISSSKMHNEELYDKTQELE